jgi:protease-4
MISVLASMRQSWLDGIRSARTDPQAVAAAENGPWVPKAAVSIGLVDHIGYESDVKRALKDRSGKSELESAFRAQRRRESALDVSRLLRALTGADDAEHAPHVAILPAQGGITMEEGNGFSQEGIAAKPMTKLIRKLAKDDSVKAVVLRIDSPGGSALASDLLWHELAQLKEEKPLIASVGNMAASGGYYLASAASQILAERTSIVGSIGVVGGKIVFGHALDRYGVSSHTFAASDQPDAGARAAYLSVLTDWDEPTRQRVQSLMDSIYELFLDRVATGRQMDREAVHEVAQGRIWSGAQGHVHGLVDELGGLADAVDLARSEAGLPPDAPVRMAGPVPNLLRMLGLDDQSDEEEVRAALSKLQAEGPSWLRGASADQRRYLEALAPLLQGEHVLTVMPFAFEAK